MMDELQEMFELQELFMRRLQAVKGHDEMPNWPLDMTEKENQVFLKGIAYESMGELFEAIKELKNSKKHRQTDLPEFDRDRFLEEAVDAYKYFLEILIFMGVTHEEFHDAYKKKDAVLHERIDNGY